MTAHAMKGDQGSLFGAGMDGYLSKPIRTQELDEILEKYLNRRAEMSKNVEMLKFWRRPN